MPKERMFNNRKRTRGRSGLALKYRDNLFKKNIPEFLRQFENKNQRTGRR